MNIWVCMFICNLIVPLMMVVFGIIFIKNPPKKINWIYGYRTKLSMKNEETWKFAHEYCGMLWEKIGTIIGIITVIAMLLIKEYSNNMIEMIGMVICMIQCAIIVSTAFFVEKKLRDKFENNK